MFEGVFGITLFLKNVEPVLDWLKPGKAFFTKARIDFRVDVILLYSTLDRVPCWLCRSLFV